MPTDFIFRGVAGRGDLLGLLDFLRLQDLGYPNYGDWVSRVEADVDSGRKEVVLAFQDGKLAGNVIHQPHAILPRVQEVKNLRVDKRARGRYVGLFLLRQAEVDGAGRFDATVCDVRPGQTDMEGLLLVSGYRRLGAVTLYDDVPDVVFMKTPTERQGLLASARIHFGTE